MIVFFTGVFLRLPIKILAPIMVLFVDRKSHPVWGVRDATDLSWWNTGLRNAAHNFMTRATPMYTTQGSDNLENLDGFQWRYRESLDGVYVSFRCTWGAPRNKGKKEFYIGWIMNDDPTMRLTFFQLRMF